MHSVLFSIGPVTIYGYGFMMALGMITCVLFAIGRAPKYGLDSDYLFNAGIIGIIAGLIGAKLTYWIVEIRQVIADPSILLQLGNGFVVYGGLIAGIVTPVLYLQFMKKVSGITYLDFAIPSIPLAQGFGRIGCFLAGCCYGAECPADAWYAVTFPAGSIAPSGVPLIPAQLISSLGDFAIFGVLLMILRREKFKGQLIAVYMMLYSVGRFLIEFLRNDPRGSVGALSTSQFIAIFIFLAGLVLYVVFRKMNGEPLKVIVPDEINESQEDNDEVHNSEV